ncbi:mitochondrial dynamin GTPase Msp1, partial [Coemansia thaxteri]
MQPHTRKLLIDTFYIVATQVLAYYGIRYMLSNARGAENKGQKERGKAVAKRLNLTGLQLNDYESTIMGEVVLPDDVAVTFEQIGGLDDIIQDLNESVIYPLNHPEL